MTKKTSDHAYVCQNCKKAETGEYYLSWEQRFISGLCDTCYWCLEDNAASSLAVYRVT